MVSGIVTVALLAVFVGGWAWAWSPRRRGEFEEAARLPLLEECHQARGAGHDVEDDR